VYDIDVDIRHRICPTDAAMFDCFAQGIRLATFRARIQAAFKFGITMIYCSAQIKHTNQAGPAMAAAAGSGAAAAAAAAAAGSAPPAAATAPPSPSSSSLSDMA
jgi:hypothetical protein